MQRFPSKKLMVFVLGGISGGTGSGTFIDVPYIIQSALKSALNMNESDDVWDRLMMMGYFVTPDVNQIHHANKRLGINGYAALKELDYLMGIQERGERFIQQYTANPADTINTNNRPYSLVNFVSSTYQDGSPVSDAYDNAMLAIAENVIYFTANDAADDNFGAWAFQNNVETEIKGLISTMEENGSVRPVGYRYGIIGSSGKILPVQDIMTCLASKLFQRIDEMWEAHGEPTTAEVQQIVGPRYFAFDGISLSNRLKKGIAYGFENIAQDQAAYPSSALSAIKHGGDAMPDFERMFQSMKAVIDSNFSNQDTYDAIEDNFNDKLSQFFKNIAPIVIQNPAVRNQKPTYGPRFANDILVGVEGGRELNTKAFIINEVNKHSSLYQQINDQLPSMYQSADTMRQEVKSKIFGASSSYEEYMKRMVDIYNLKLQQYLSVKLVDVYQKILDMVTEANHSVYGVIFSTLTSLRQIFADNMNIMGNVDQKKSLEGAVMSWYVVDFTEVNDTIEQMLNENKLEVSAENLYATIWDHRNRWSSDDPKNYKVFDEITDFLAVEFNEILNIGLEKYIENDYKNNYSTQYPSFEEFIRRKFNNDLLEEAKIRFSENPLFRTQIGDPSLIPGRCYIQVPKDCTVIRSQIKMAFEGDRRKSVVGSDNKTRITYNNIQYGMPLFSYAPMETYEALYEQNVNTEFGEGLHIYQHGDVNWVDLPALVYPSARSTIYANLREDARIEDTYKIFDEAVRFGVVRSNPDGAEAVFSGNIDIEKMIEEAGNNPVRIENLINELKSYLEIEKDLPGNTSLYRNAEGKDIVQMKGSTMEKVKFWFSGAYELVGRIRVELEKYYAIEEAIKRVEESYGQFDNYKVLANALLTDTLVKNGPKFFYAPSFQDDQLLISSVVDLEDSDFAAYSLFKKVFNDATLVQSHFERFLKDTEDRFKALQSVDDFEADYYPIVRGLKADIDQIVSNIEANYSNIKNAEDIATFYAVIKKYLDDLSK